jgi:signal transduction histidine kinase
MNIRQRITLLIVTTFLTLSFVGGFAVYQSRGSSREVKTVTEGVVPSAIASVELVTQLKDVQIATMNMVSATDKASATSTKDQVVARKATLEKALQTQLERADSDAQRGLVKQAQESLVNYFDAIDQTAQFKMAGQDAMAAATMSATVDQYLNEQAAIIETLQIEKRRSKDVAIETLNSNLGYTSQTLSMVTVVAILGLAAMGVLLYRQIILPISDMQNKMTEIATSQDFTHRVPVNRMDEIGKSLTAFNTMVEKIQESSDLVKQKTADIQAMLHYIPQGILTVTSGNKVHPEYSSFLESILETKEIAGKDLLELVFSNTNLGSDAMSQIDAALSACIGEDAMNFEFNEHVLAHEFERTMPDGRIKVLDVSWSPIVDDNNVVVRLMLCLWDVTELRSLAAEATAQKRELSMIGEVLAVNQEKFHSFIEGAHNFIDENRALIPSATAMSVEARATEVVSLLFRNMHTIKGNARTYGLLTLTNVVHEAEQAYDELRKNPELAWDEVALLAQLSLVEDSVTEYARVNEMKLGRKGPGRRGGVDKFLMIQKDHVQDALKLLEGLDDAAPAALRDAINRVRSSLRLIGTEKIEDALAGVVESLPSLAKELGKPAPEVTFEAHGIVLKTQIADTVKNVFMHLYRNSMDHGLETAAERISKGKPEKGSIALKMQLDNGNVHFTLKDDGKGLAVGPIRRKAVTQGLIDDAAALSSQEIAQLIFAAGFSTAEEVTEVSGRGVGMDAVKGFVEREGGTIEVRLLPDSEAAGKVEASGGNQEFRAFETVITLPEKYVVQT